MGSGFFGVNVRIQWRVLPAKDFRPRCVATLTTDVAILPNSAFRHASIARQAGSGLEPR